MLALCHTIIANYLKAALYGASWEDAKDDDTVNRFVQYAVDTLDQRAKAAGMYYDSVWINDAAPFQTKQVFPKYGGGKNYAKLKQIAHKYGRSSPTMPECHFTNAKGFVRSGCCVPDTAAWRIQAVNPGDVAVAN